MVSPRMSQFQGSADAAAARGSEEKTATASRNRRVRTYMPMSRVWSAPAGPSAAARRPEVTARAWIRRPSGRCGGATQPRRSASRR